LGGIHVERSVEALEMLENILLLSGLLARQRQLEKLVGPAWRDLRHRILDCLRTIGRTGADATVQSDVDGLLETLLQTQAAPLVREILRGSTIQGATRRSSQPPPTERDLDDMNDYLRGFSRAAEACAKSEPIPVRPHLKELVREIIAAAEHGDFGDVATGTVSGDDETAGMAPVRGGDVDARPVRARDGDEMRINAWLTEQQEAAEPIEVGREYTLNLNVGRAVPTSLVPDQHAIVSELDVPDTGLDLTWTISSSTVELHPGDPEVAVTLAEPREGLRLWTARFSVRVHRRRETDTRRIRIIPRARHEALLSVLIAAGGEIYRDFRIALSLTDVRTATPPGNAAAVKVVGDTCYSPAAQLNLRNTHEWTTPPGRLTLFITNHIATVSGDAAGKDVAYVAVWQVSAPQLAGKMLNVRSAAERFRVAWETYLNDVGPEELPARVRNLAAQYQWPYDWGHLPNHADPAHDVQWQTVATSPELRELAVYGRQLYDAVFTPGSPLRAEIDGLYPGHRLNIFWPGADVSDVPWGLMYALDPPVPGAPVDPTGFFSFRFRVEHRPYSLQGGAKHLGGLDETRRAYLLYWGTQAADAVAAEAKWQRSEWTSSPLDVVLPDAAARDPKGELMKFFTSGQGSPVSVVYFFCHCSVGDGNDPVLRFGPTIQAKDTVRGIDLPQQLADRPLVFVNACTSTGSDPYKVNDLEYSFLSGGCRAYLGTESKVPVQFASRFGWVFFRFLFRLVDPLPLAAGEAAVQTRLFFWTQYRNIGGLFYSYVNQYELFAATDREVRALGR
jgi:hypothetical protein